LVGTGLYAQYLVHEEDLAAAVLDADSTKPIPPPR